MKLARIAGRWMRLVTVMSFGFMTLGHGPIMTFAHAAKHDTSTVASVTHHHAAAHDRAAHDHASHQHHGLDIDHDLSPPATDNPMVCNAFGCFIAVRPVVQTPAQELMPIGKLLPVPPSITLPIFTEPADPPPRLHG
jgi:hypothetical protein